MDEYQPPVVTRKELQKICEDAWDERATWRHEDYFGEDLYITPNGKCLYEGANWWLPSEEDAQYEIRQNVFKTWISTIFTQRDLLVLKKGKDTEEDVHFGFTVEYLEKRIPQKINHLQIVFGLTLEEIEAACVQEGRKREAYKMRDTWYQNDPQGLAKKGAEGYPRRLEIDEEHKEELSDPILPEKNHQFGYYI